MVSTSPQTNVASERTGLDRNPDAPSTGDTYGRAAHEEDRAMGKHDDQVSF
jgi:hypothetical protein